MDYYESEEFRVILKSYEEAKKHNRNCYLDSDDFLDVVDYYMRDRNFEAALEAAEKGRSMHPDDDALIGMQVSALINMSQFDRATKVLEEMVPDENYDCYYFKAQLAIAERHDYDEADIWFRKWIDWEKEDARKENHGKNFQPRISEAYLHIVASISELTPNTKKRLNPAPHIEKWVEEYEKDCAPLGNYDTDLDIARVCHEEGLEEREQHLYELFLDTNPYLPNGWHYLASLQHLNCHYEEAANSATYALAINPNNDYALYLRAHSYFIIGNYRSALKDFLRYEKIKSSVDNWISIGRCFMLLGMKAEACAYLEKASKSIQNSTRQLDNAPNWVLWSRIVRTYTDGRLYDDALNTVDSALKAHPDETELIIRKADIFLRKGDFAEARYWFDKSLETTTRHSSLMFTIAEMYASVQQYDEAILYAQAVEKIGLELKSLPVYAFLAYIYQRLGDATEFRHYLTLAYREFPESLLEYWSDKLAGVSPKQFFEVLKDLI